jgi:CheY-like chemotaxis protein
MTAETTLLLAEDDSTTRYHFERVLVGKGYHVIAARDGDEALRLAGQHPGPIHLLITDLAMPHVDGAELARQFKRRWPNKPILM